MTTPPRQPPQPGDAAAFRRMLDGRFSCRGYKPQRVPRETIEAILATAQRTASWCNAQPWQVAVASGAAVEAYRQEMLKAAMQPPEPTDFEWPRQYNGVYGERRRECGLALYESVGIAKGDREASGRQALENFRLFGAPHVAIVTADAALGVYGAVDCGAWVANFMTAAWTHGVASVAQAALAVRPGVARRHFGLEADRRVLCGISFGFADEAHRANHFSTPRADLSQVVSWHE